MAPRSQQEDAPSHRVRGTRERASQLWLCLHLPRLGLELFTRGLADGAARRPVVLVAARQVVQVNATGRARGLQAGMSLSTAESICADLAIAWRDEAREAEALERLAFWAYRFTPRVSPEPPADLLLEVAGSLRLFRGLDRLQQRIVEGITDLGWSAHPGLAPTPLAARALARTGQGPDVDALAADLVFERSADEVEKEGGRDGEGESAIRERAAVVPAPGEPDDAPEAGAPEGCDPAGEGRDVQDDGADTDRAGDGALRQAWCAAVARAARPRLANLPLEHLDRPAAELEQFQALGLRTLKDLLRLPRAGLGRRFGRGLVDHLDRLTGRRPDPRPALTPPETFSSTVHFLEDLEHQAALAFPMQRLAGELADWLRLRQQTTDRLDWELVHPRHGRHRIRVRFARPQAEVARLLEFSRLQLERDEGLPAVGSLVLRVTRLITQDARDGALFPEVGDAEGGGEDPALLVDRLRARLGDRVCRSLIPADDHRPERAWCSARPVPPRAAGQRGGTGPPARRRGTDAGTAAPVDLPSGPRPLWLLTDPLILTERDGVPCWHGPLTLCRGPERIDVGWWEGPAGGAAASGDGLRAGEVGDGVGGDRVGGDGVGGDGTDGYGADAPSPVALLVRDGPDGDAAPPRDYWVARHPGGGHLWLFQERHGGRWFLHGIFS